MQDVGSRIIQYIRVSLPKHTASHPEWQQSALSTSIISFISSCLLSTQLISHNCNG
jgi:hypothetical protein